MCDPLANNFITPALFGYSESLQADKNGYPLQKQVPLTRTSITSTGGALTDAIPTEELVSITGVLAANLVITMTAQGCRNMYGRKTVLAKTNSTLAFNVQLILPAGTFFSYAGAAVPLVITSMTFPAAATCQDVILYWAENRVHIVGNVAGFTFA